MNLAAFRARRTLLTLAAVVAALAVSLAGCTAAVPSETPGITGDITYLAISTTSTALVSITVEGGVQPTGAVSDKAVVTVTAKTAIFDADGKRARVDALQVGKSVKVWFEGPVAESYPVQGRAAAVQIVGDAASAPSRK
jgi:beta-N-acetylhexosaminidase